jgi:hypothetical protein
MNMNRWQGGSTSHAATIKLRDSPMRVLDWWGCQVPADRRPAQGAAAARRPSCIIATGADSRQGLRMVKSHPEEALMRRVWSETAVHQWNARKTPGPLSIDVPSAMKALAPLANPPIFLEA